MKLPACRASSDLPDGRRKRIKSGPYKPALIKAHKKWGDVETWKLIKQFSPAYTDGYFLAAVDAKRQVDGTLKRVDEDARIYIELFWRTLKLSLIITVMTLILGFPIAYPMAILPTRTSNLLLIFVLLPFWTSPSGANNGLDRASSATRRNQRISCL